MNQQMMPPQQVLVVAQPNSSVWSSGVFDCDQDCGSFILGWCCPCIQYGTNMDILNKSGSFGPACSYCLLMCVGCQCFLGSSGRGHIRTRYGIAGDNAEDCMLHCCCVPCALSQEYREVMKRDSQRVPVVVQGQVMAPVVVQQPGYYPPQNQGYPPQNQGYPPQNQGYPPQNQGYPVQNQGYPPAQNQY